ncbi:MAG: 4Fe-4S binding protein [Clostridia bacterium]|nr:4Fe-4S binding protein [Clostridia bacterium]
MTKIKEKIKSILPTKRRLIQLYSALLFNANIKGFFNGKIYKGPLKNLCTPGLNCYSCPGASGSCPLGALQNSLAETGKSAPYYMLGIILLYGILFGRFICGFLCPFGLIQDLLYKIKTPKLKKNKITKILSYFKYVVLVFFVIIVPLMYAFRDFPLPAFCKYICPAGTLEGAMGLLSNKVNESELARLGPLFTWKFALMVSTVVGAIFIYRIFCRFVCPLGALYGLFNRISVLGIKLDKPKCVDCGLCISKCKMDIHSVGDAECISCGDCVSVCPTKAISYKGGKIILPENEIEGAPAEARAKKSRSRAVKILIASVMSLTLIGALVYYNFIDKAEPPAPPVTDGEYGSEIGDKCYGADIPLFDETGELGTTFNPANNAGKITVINFWGTWCGPCKEELPDFDRIAGEYADTVTVIAIHTEYRYSTAADYVLNNFKDSNMLFGRDVNDAYYALLDLANDTYPITLVLDGEGTVIETIVDVIHYDDLKAIIDGELNKQ